MEPLLTILLPTWNRRKNLEELLSILLPGLHREPDVHLLVSNNGSTDDTAAYLNSLPEHPRLQVIHQPANVGVHVHIGWLYGQARGRFLWGIGDDDLPSPETLGVVCQKLRERPNLGLVHLPHRYLASEGEPIASYVPAQAEFYETGRLAFPRYISWLALYTANILRTSLVQPLLPQMDWGSYYVPLALLLRGCADHPAFIPNRHFVVAGAATTWEEKWTRTVYCGFPVEILQTANLSSSERRACLRQAYADSPHRLSRLLFFAPGLLWRLIRTEPGLLRILLRPSELKKPFRKSFWRRLRALSSGPQKAASQVFRT